MKFLFLSFTLIYSTVHCFLKEPINNTLIKVDNLKGNNYNNITFRNKDESESNIVNLEENSFLALQRISEGLMFLYESTSCKVAGKYVLLIIANIQREEDRHRLNLTDNVDENLEMIKNKLKQGKIIQIEFYPNHHIILFAKNQTHLFILQAFQYVYQLKDWMRNLENMEPKNMEDFFSTVKSLLDKNNTDKEKFEKVMLSLFMPDYFINTPQKITAMKNWFSRVNHCDILKVDCVDYDFRNDPLDAKYFYNLFRDVDSHFLLRVTPQHRKWWQIF